MSVIARVMNPATRYASPRSADFLPFSREKPASQIEPSIVRRLSASGIARDLGLERSDHVRRVEEGQAPLNFSAVDLAEEAVRRALPIVGPTAPRQAFVDGAGVEIQISVEEIGASAADGKP